MTVTNNNISRPPLSEQQRTWSTPNAIPKILQTPVDDSGTVSSSPSSSMNKNLEFKSLNIKNRITENLKNLTEESQVIECIKKSLEFQRNYILGELMEAIHLVTAERPQQAPLFFKGFAKMFVHVSTENPKLLDLLCKEVITGLSFKNLTPHIYDLFQKEIKHEFELAKNNLAHRVSIKIKELFFQLVYEDRRPDILNSLLDHAQSLELQETNEDAYFREGSYLVAFIQAAFLLKTMKQTLETTILMLKETYGFRLLGAKSLPEQFYKSTEKIIEKLEPFLKENKFISHFIKTYSEKPKVFLKLSISTLFFLKILCKYFRESDDLAKSDLGTVFSRYLNNVIYNPQNKTNAHSDPKIEKKLDKKRPVLYKKYDEMLDRVIQAHTQPTQSSKEEKHDN